jgi:hypothetical protein
MATNTNRYIIYFEINNSNIELICRNTTFTKKFWGYDQGQYQNQYGYAIGFAPGYNMGNPSTSAKWKGDTLKCPMSVNNSYPSNNPDMFNLCYDGTVSSVNKSLDKYPIVGYRDNQNYEFNERRGTLPLTSFSIPTNSFNRGWPDVVGADNILFKCPTCTNNGSDGNTANVGKPEQTYMYSNGKMRGGAQFEYTNLLGKTAEKTVSCNCYGEECENWFPPRDSGAPVQGWTYTGLAGCIWFNDQSNAGDGYQHIRSLTNICMTGEPTFTYNTYLPIPYNLEPDVVKSKYIPPKNLTNVAYYNYGLFSNPTLELILSLNPGPSSMTIQDTTNASCTQANLYNLLNIPSAFAVYSLTYNISNENFKNSDLQNQILDFLYLYESLSDTFTNDFKNSCFYKDSQNAIKQMVIEYCSKSENMSFSLCSDIYLPFTFLNQSPCVENPGFCKSGFLNFCSKPENYNNLQCLQYYSQSYDGTQLDTDTQVMLQNLCQEMYNSEEDKSNLPQDFATVCGCYLPKEVYENYLKKNNMNSDIIGYPQCWYLPCITSAVQPSTKPQCPSNSVTNCIQYKYVTVKNTETNEVQTNMTESTLKNCGETNYIFNTTPENSRTTSDNLNTTPATMESFTFLEQKNKNLNRIFFILILVLVVMIVLKKFFI